jgi:hypothetical protein
MIVLMIVRMLIIYLGIHLMLRVGDVHIGRWILRVIVVSAVVVKGWIRIRLVNWCWWLIKAIVVGLIIIVSVIVHSVRLVLVRIVVPIVWLCLMVIHGLSVMLLVVVP